VLYAKILVKGNVQNVRYREYVKTIAILLNINGIARHCLGDVEIEIEARDEAELLEFVRLIEKKRDAKFPIDVKSAAVVSKTVSSQIKFTKFSVE
jgi:acylphosphatase